MKMLTKYFEQELSSLGYIDAKVEWSLNHCQGDGVWFTVSLLNSESIEILLGRLMSNELDELNRDAMMRYMIDHGSYYNFINIERYRHSMMSLEWIVELPSPEEAVDTGHSPLQMLQWEWAWEVFIKRLSDDYKSIESKLIESGHVVIEAIATERKLIREYRTANFLVQFHEEEANMHEFDDDLANPIDDLLSGKYRLADLTATVLDENNEIIASESLGDCVWKNDERNPWLRDLCTEAIASARNYLAEQAFSQLEAA